MITDLMKFGLDDLLSYCADCHGLSAYDLSERDVDIKSKEDVADAIQAYGWATECKHYLA